MVATRMFAERGFSGTTTREIAAKAEVNEALIFRHFPTKEELYWAVLESKIRASDLHERLRELLAGAKDVRAGLTAVAEWTLRRHNEDYTSMRLSLFCALEHHDLARRFFGHFTASYFEVLAEYLRQQMASGKLRQMDPLMATRGFLGMLVYHSLVKELFGAIDPAGSMDPVEVSRLVVSLWLDGMLVEKTSSESGAADAAVETVSAQAAN